MDTILHSIVIPVFNEEDGLAELYRRLTECLFKPLELKGERLEFIFIDDGSKDRSLEILHAFHKKDPNRVRVLSFSRNFGHQVAITAGMENARGETVTVIDADLQDPPEVILALIDQWRAGFDVVYAKRQKRKSEGLLKRITASLFYRMLRSSTGLDIPVDTGDFRLMSRRAVKAMCQLHEQHRFVRGLASWVGYKQTSVLYVREARFAGETKYPLKKMIRLAWDAFSGFSLVPLRIATYAGLFAAGLSLILAVYAIYSKLFSGTLVQGWTSIMITVLFLGGAQLFTIGILGEYIGRIFEESKKRPLYILKEKLGFNED